MFIGKQTTFPELPEIGDSYDPGVSADMSKVWKKVAEEAYESFLVACTGTTTCDSGTCYTNAGESWGRICVLFGKGKKLKS